MDLPDSGVGKKTLDFRAGYLSPIFDHHQTSFYSRPLKNTGTSVSSQKENKERWGIILNHLIVNKPPDVSSKATEKRGLV